MKYTKKLEYRTFYADESISFLNLRFENDVNMYGTQAASVTLVHQSVFENDVNMYGTQADCAESSSFPMFENDVNMYGTQAMMCDVVERMTFENDVNMYGTQAEALLHSVPYCLRMM